MTARVDAVLLETTRLIVVCSVVVCFSTGFSAPVLANLCFIKLCFPTRWYQNTQFHSFLAGIVAFFMTNSANGNYYKRMRDEIQGQFNLLIRHPAQSQKSAPLSFLSILSEQINRDRNEDDHQKDSDHSLSHDLQGNIKILHYY